ncbi:MAG: efflux RND transporter periplasmic adaptor subunit [bacterium]|nr:efflux RND transporter periplasmic adaptor subunit [bacterium]
MRKLAIAVLAVAGTLASGCASHAGDAADAQSVPVTVAVARDASFAAPLELSGSLTAVQNVTLGAAAAGRIVRVNVRVGDRVRAGEVLAQVDPSAYSAQYAGAQAGAGAAVDSERAAGAALEQARSRMNLAQSTARRMNALYAAGAISKQQQDESQASAAASQAAYAQAQASLAAARGLAAQAQAGVAAAAVPLGETAIAAPFDGVVTQKLVEPGAVVGAGSPVVAVQNTSDLELDIAVPEDRVAALVPGTRVAVRVDALGSDALGGRVRAIVPSQDPALRSATVRVGVEPHAGLLPGMFARVSIAGAPQRGVGVPMSALVTRAGQSGVFAIVDKTASFVPVQTGASQHGLIAVTGIKAGTQVAVSNVARLTEGSSVSVQP